MVQKELAPDGFLLTLENTVLPCNFLILQMTGWRIEILRNSSVLESFEPTSKSKNPL